MFCIDTKLFKYIDNVFLYKFMVIFASRNEYEVVFSQRKKSLNFFWGIWYMVNIWLNKSLKVLAVPLFFVSELRSVFEIFMYKHNTKDFRWHISKKKNYFRHETNIPLVLYETNLMPLVAEFCIIYDHYILVTSLSNLNNSLLSQYQTYIFIL